MIILLEIWHIGKRVCAHPVKSTLHAKIFADIFLFVVVVVKYLSCSQKWIHVRLKFYAKYPTQN